ncbi:hypothetical protein EDB86DRAFT_1436619 [Lactarius hatsudake]|nr:hypothetical protein EDB86DRAFT_1436619 [Lactarius hatsudake]
MDLIHGRLEVWIHPSKPTKRSSNTAVFSNRHLDQILITRLSSGGWRASNQLLRIVRSERQPRQIHYPEAVLLLFQPPRCGPYGLLACVHPLLTLLVGVDQTHLDVTSVRAALRALTWPVGVSGLPVQVYVYIRVQDTLEHKYYMYLASTAIPFEVEGLFRVLQKEIKRKHPIFRVQG